MTITQAATIKKIPCPEGRVRTSPLRTTSLFVFDETNTGSGIGWRHADAGVDRAGGVAYITEYDDSETYTNHAEWYAADNQAGPIE